MRHVEHQHQKALIQWAERTRIPAASDIEAGAVIADYLFSVPMGGKRNPIEAKRLKAEGAKAGVSDLILPVRRQGLGGLFLELKRPGERPTKLQSEWLERMERAGYLSTWADDWLRAAAIICRYLGIPEPLPRIQPQQEPQQCNESSENSPKRSGLPTRSKSSAAGAAANSTSPSRSRKATPSR